LQSSDWEKRSSSLNSLSQTEDHSALLVETGSSKSVEQRNGNMEDTQPVTSSSSNKSYRMKSLLGREICLYLHTPLTRQTHFFLMILGLIAVLLPLFLGVRQFQILEDAYGYYAALQRSQVWIYLALLAFLALLFSLVMRSRNLNEFVALYQNGIRFRLKSKRVCWILYQNISGLQEVLIQENFLFIPVKKNHLVNVYPKNGRTISIPSSISDLAGLYANLLKLVNPVLKRRIQDIFNSGQLVEFGEIKVNKYEFRYRHRTIQLEQVRDVSIHSGKLLVTVKPRAFTSEQYHMDRHFKQPDVIRIPLSKVINLEILLDIIQTRIRP
jgi:hypothetical protein